MCHNHGIEFEKMVKILEVVKVEILEVVRSFGNQETEEEEK